MDMKAETLKCAAYKQPDCEVLDLIAETSLMLAGSQIEEGEYEVEDIW